ncbi:MAG: hypothetical protein COU31_04310 [Candidatus Magasanikbacteria bacterium CG10_big_fil_rev_8_21_14_0_10_40_10]|uniref:Epoxyqueuosine reductase QueH n=1 Tax=Candidatus Magasanikbacteria bacterium CG10_big_fil_rev_8_21_14_0_10_40_10 TaxID=1974648 RepID=A0A2M6W2Y7_9BACT|nr:MAG: hypothetical protein COU31_04310 [Candidatus Magasanikbacteria bacterium CG10_big_fil_rev_8_21_14_0_10_40_10]
MSLQKPKLLLHVCCAPCSIAVIDELKNQFDLTVFFYNPNIYPKAEYLKRKKYVMLICREWNVPMIDADYETDIYARATIGLTDEPEGGRRCRECFKLRLAKTAKYSAEGGWRIFSTSLSSGRNKKAEMINAIGQELARQHGLEFLSKDWKKDGRQEKARQMIAQRNIYRQDYCGCVYSLKGVKKYD